MIKRTCKICNKDFLVPPSRLKHRKAYYCSNVCKSEGYKGSNNLFWGKKHTKETLKKISKKLKGRKLTPEWKEKIRLSEVGIRGKRKYGKNHHRWNGGYTKLRQKIGGYPFYAKWRKDIFIRDNFECKKCNKRGTYINAHHIIPFSTLLKQYNIKTVEQARNCKELWNLDNGITLCIKCHKPITKGINNEKL